MKGSEFQITGSTEADELAIDEAMTRAKGVVSVAARELGINVKTLYPRIDASDFLRTKWRIKDKATAPPSSAVVIHKPLPPPIDVEATEEELSDAWKKEDESVKLGLQKICPTGAEADIAYDLQAYTRKHFSSVVDLAGGGIARTVVKVLVAIDSIEKELASGVINTKMLEDGSAVSFRDVELERVLRDDRANMLVWLTKAHSVLSKDKSMREEALARKRQSRVSSNKPRGFLAVQAHPGSKVDIKTG